MVFISRKDKALDGFLDQKVVSKLQSVSAYRCQVLTPTANRKMI